MGLFPKRAPAAVQQICEETLSIPDLEENRSFAVDLATCPSLGFVSESANDDRTPDEIVYGIGRQRSGAMSAFSGGGEPEMVMDSQTALLASAIGASRQGGG